MARQVVEWADQTGQRHNSEELAERADLRIAAEQVLETAHVIINHREICFTNLEGYNVEALKPLKTYIDLLWTEAESRQRHGEKVGV